MRSFHLLSEPISCCLPLFVIQDMAYILATGYVGTSILLAGFIIRPNMLQVKPMLWLSYVSYPRWVLHVIPLPCLAAYRCMCHSGHDLLAAYWVSGSHMGVCHQTTPTLSH